MSKLAPRAALPMPRPKYPSDLRRLFRQLARVAVASSFGVGGIACTSNYTLEDFGPNVQDMDGGVEPPMTGGSGAPPTGGSIAPPTGGSIAPPTGGSIAPPPPPPSADWKPITCDSEGRPMLFGAATLEQPIDHAAVYRMSPMFGEWVGDDAGPADTTMFTSTHVYGRACASATEVAACTDAIEALIPSTQDCAIEGQCDPFIITTSGDIVTRIEERAALSALLGAVDSTADAAIAVLLADGYITCWSDQRFPPMGTRARKVDGGYEVQTNAEVCGSPTFERVWLVQTNGTVTLTSQTEVAPPTCAIGRRPEGLRPASAQAFSAACPELGTYFASAARLEAASVHAFERFALELQILGAPEQLVAGASRAALEEISHAHVVSAIARRFGGELAPVVIDAMPTRDAFAIAVENAVEGCVRETYGALVACYQASAASDPSVRAAMEQIADDETRHAELSWRVAQWLEPQLSEPQQLAVTAARRAAFDQLEGELHDVLSPSARALIGLPDSHVSASLLRQLGTALAIQA